MGGANQYRHSSSKKVNINICGRVATLLLPKPVQIPSFMCSGTMVIELHEINDKTQALPSAHV